MRKADLALSLAKRQPQLSHKTIKKLINRLFYAMSQALSLGYRIEIRNFGSFSLRVRKAGIVRNPRYRMAITVNARNVVYFRPGKGLAQRVNNVNNNLTSSA